MTNWQDKLFITKVCRTLALRYLKQFHQGGITLQENNHSIFAGDKKSPLQVTLVIQRPRFYRRLIFGGSLGVAQSYLDKDWRCSDLTVLFQLIVLNRAILQQLNRGLSQITHQLRSLPLYFLRNHIKRSKRNILAHYDLGNDFFRLFLDQRKLYSCASYTSSTQSLDEAQENKLRDICERLELNCHDHLLEIGTGWGGLALFAAQTYGCKVTTTTISDAQYDEVQQQIISLGLENKITLLKKDYRELQGQFDKVVSIEMIEAVGHQYFTTFFSVCDRLLKPKGLFFLQAIVINEGEYERYKREQDFIKTYIFPGGCLPCITVMLSAVKRYTTLRLVNLNDIGQDYAKTLADWDRRLIEKKEDVLNQGYNETLLHLFHYYFNYCRAGFLTNYISTVQMLMVKV